MKQIYYTQCPIGYGLGASNGFQIKRLSAGYPVTSDFRHLGLRAFVPGTRQMAPASLRYRRAEGGQAEIAFLSPRSHEYETERGLWGRPGGHFAHGLQLDRAELEAIDFWPAGLYDARFWARSDPGPSREESPPEVPFPPEPPGSAPTFDQISRHAAAVGEERLARLLSALATVLSEGRTLFLIDAAERLAAHVMLLTFAFPGPLREGLTFSTYHDRPEDLPGLRLQGTTAAARPNRAVLLSLGIVADLEKGTIEPESPPMPWAQTLAGWLARGGEADRRAFEATQRRALVTAKHNPAACGESEWLEHVVALEAALTDTQKPPDWPLLARLASWCGRNGLGKDWTDARGPAWWRERVGTGTDGLDALVAHLTLPSAWHGRESATAWGQAVARAFEGGSADARTSALADVLRASPVADRPGFIRALIRDLPPGLASQTLHALRAQPECGPALLLPLEVRGAVAALRDHGSAKELLRRLTAALALPGTLPAVLDALAEAAEDRAEPRDALPRTLAEAFETADARGRSLVLGWALERRDAADWLGPALRRAFADALNTEAWRALLAQTPARLRPQFARVVLTVAGDPTLPDEAFRWGIEEVLLGLPENERPEDPAWPGAFLSRTRSDLDLIKWLYAKKFVKPGIKAWLKRARERGDLNPGQEARLDACRHYVSVLREGNARALLDTRLPVVPAEERGAVLGQILASLDTASTDAFELALDAARDAWPGGFDAEAPGLAGLGQVIADAIAPLRDDPPYWLDRLTGVVDRLGLAARGDGFSPWGLAGEVLAATCRGDVEAFSPWRLRYGVLASDVAWRILAADIRADLATQPGPRSLDVLDTWDRALEKGLHTNRFFEVWLNACEAHALALSVASRAAALKHFDLSWWDHARHPGARDDLRDAFARLAPLAPIANEALPDVEKWLAPSGKVFAPQRALPVYDEAGLAPLEEIASSRARPERLVSRLSDLGDDRWACIKALSDFDSHGIEALGRWGRLLQTTTAERLKRLGPADGYRFLAWLIHLSDEYDEVPVAQLGVWLLRAGLTDGDRFGVWHEELEGLAEVTGEAQLRRTHLVSELRSEMRRVLNDERERRRISRGDDSP